MKVDFNPILNCCRAHFDWKKPQTKAIALVCIALVGAALLVIKRAFFSKDTSSVPGGSSSIMSTSSTSSVPGGSSSIMSTSATSPTNSRSFLAACLQALNERIENFQTSYQILCNQSNCGILSGGADVNPEAFARHCQKAMKVRDDRIHQHRYGNVLSFDATNVYREDPSKYYPANYLTQIAKGNIIASQGPANGHSFDFLQMLIDVNCKFLIVVANDLDGRKYTPYLDQIFEKDGSMIQVVVAYELERGEKEDDPTAPYIVQRQLTLAKESAPVSLENEDVERHTLMQHQLVNWPDTESVDSKILYDFVVKVISEYDLFCGDGETLVTHCSAGVGCTGVFAYIFGVIWEFQNRFDEGDFAHPLTQELLDDFFLSMRRPETGRWPMMVQTADQYKCALEVIRMYVQSRA
ncbi:MAG: hypothetical protein K940chlam8_00931 [Chlamydiae bacterium]|nr:hypothetical protein [Chlamydiota bacterium]